MTNPYQASDASFEPPAGRRDSLHGEVTESILVELKGTRAWVMFMGVIGFLIGGLVIVSGLFVGLGSVIGAASGDGAATAMALGMSLFYIVLSAIYLVPSYFLVRYGLNISKAANTGEGGDIVAALASQRRFWRITGIMVLLAMYDMLAVRQEQAQEAEMTRMASEVLVDGGSGPEPVRGSALALGLRIEGDPRDVR